MMETTKEERDEAWAAMQTSIAGRESLAARLIRDVDTLEAVLRTLLRMPHYNNESELLMGDCLSEDCMHGWNEWPDEDHADASHSAYGGCCLISFPDGGEKEWHDRNCDWVKARAALA